MASMPASAPTTPKMMAVELFEPGLLDDCLEDIPDPADWSTAVDEDVKLV